MAYQMYRSTTLGATLKESLDELVANQSITQELALKVMVAFDRNMNKALNMRVKSKLNFNAGKLEAYRFCDNVWTFVLSDVEFREVQEVEFVGKVKIVACDAAGSAGYASSNTGPGPSRRSHPPTNVLPAADDDSD